MEFDVAETLRTMGHEVHQVGVEDDLGLIRKAIAEFKPHIVFNLLESFHGVSVFDSHVVSFLELLRIPYTGCNPRGLMLARDKALAKTLMSGHRIPVPEFTVVRMGRKVRRPKRLSFPLIVKSLTQEASIGISRASVVEDDERLAERVRFIHESIGTDAIVERFIGGRELYVGIVGNQRLRVFPVWELRFDTLPEDGRLLMTDRAKWNTKYQKKYGIMTGPADLAPEVAAAVQHLCKRVYRTLDLSGYARIDLRLDDGRGACTCWRRTPTRSSPTARTSPSRPSTAASATRGCCRRSSTTGCGGGRIGSAEGHVRRGACGDPPCVVLGAGPPTRAPASIGLSRQCERAPHRSGRSGLARCAILRARSSRRQARRCEPPRASVAPPPGAGVAQLVEQPIRNRQVTSSSLVAGSRQQEDETLGENRVRRRALRDARRRQTVHWRNRHRRAHRAGHVGSPAARRAPR